MNNPKIALVTGGSKGIGLAIVRSFVTDGYRVITCGRHAATWDSALAQDHNLKDVEFHACNLSETASLAELFEKIKSKHGHLDIAINNASPKPNSIGNFHEISDHFLLETLMADLWVPALCIKNELLIMGTGGAIVNISSTNGLRPTPTGAMYSAAKHGLEGLTRSLALEAIKRGIRINAVAPGATLTPRRQDRIDAGEISVQELNDAIPIGRLAAPEDIAAAVRCLVSEQASYIVGHTLVVDGGLSLL